MEPAGHGGQSGRYNHRHEVAFNQAFVLWQVGLKDAPSQGTPPPPLPPEAR